MEILQKSNAKHSRVLGDLENDVEGQVKVKFLKFGETRIKVFLSLPTSFGGPPVGGRVGNVTIFESGSRGTASVLKNEREARENGGLGA